MFNFDNTYRQLPANFFSAQSPQPVPEPRLVIFNHALAAELAIDTELLNEAQLAAICVGNTMPAGAEPLAQAYAGHQYGHFTTLGDGRAHLLGEHLCDNGRRVDIQLKGSGPTAYARRGDGRAALGPMLREYIISEAMAALGIPTTRSLAVATTGATVYRDSPQPGAVLTRVAGSHLRVGTFEFAASAHSPQGVAVLLDYAIDRHFPNCRDAANPSLAFFQAVIEQQVALIVDWMRVGFIHGVMNTDNMSICGETIDYGPCAFMDSYNPKTVFSSIDQRGRYAYANQPHIAQWNLARLAETLLPLIHDDEATAIEMAKQALADFEQQYQQKWLAMMRAKLGLSGEEPDDRQLVSDLLDWMESTHADYTNTFWQLSFSTRSEAETPQSPTFQDWHARWQTRLGRNTPNSKPAAVLMAKTNPTIIPRNHQVERALKSAVDGDSQPLQSLLRALRQPYCQTDAQRDYQTPPPPTERVYQTFCGT